MQGLVKLIINNLYGVRIRKFNTQSYYCISEAWMITEYDENVLDYWKLRNKKYFVAMKKDDGWDIGCDSRNTLPKHLGAFT